MDVDAFVLLRLHGLRLTRSFRFALGKKASRAPGVKLALLFSGGPVCLPFWFLSPRLHSAFFVSVPSRVRDGVEETSVSSNMCCLHTSHVALRAVPAIEQPFLVACLQALQRVLD